MMKINADMGDIREKHQAAAVLATSLEKRWKAKNQELIALASMKPTAKPALKLVDNKKGK